MSTIQEYCRKLSTETLEQILHESFENPAHYPIEVILTITDILIERTGFQADAQAGWQDFVENYMPRDKENDL